MKKAQNNKNNANNVKNGGTRSKKQNGDTQDCK